MRNRIKRVLRIFLIIIFMFSILSISFVLAINEGNKSSLEEQYKKIPFTPFFTVRLMYKQNYSEESYKKISESPFNFILLYSREISIYSLENGVSFTGNHPVSRLGRYIPITEKDLRSVLNLPSVKSAFIYNVTTSEYSKTIEFKKRQISIFPIPYNFFEDLSLPLEYGRYFSKNDTEDQIIILDNLAKTIFGTSNVIGKTVTGKNGEVYNIIGVLKPINSAYLLSMFPNTYISAFSPLPKTFKPPNHLINTGGFITYTDLGNVLAVIPKKGEYNKAISQVSRILRKDGDGDQALTLKIDSTYKEIGRMFGVKIRKERFIYVLYFSIFMILISIFTAIAFMTADILRKIKEISVKRAVGETMSMAFSEYFKYYIVLSFISFIAAILFLYASSPFLKRLNNLGLQGFIAFNMPESMLSKTPSPKISLCVLIFAVGISVLIVFISVLFPIRRIFKLPVTNGLTFDINTRNKIAISRHFIIAVIIISITGSLYISVLKNTIYNAMIRTYKETNPNVIRIIPVNRKNEVNIFSGNFYFADFTYKDYLSLKKFLNNNAYVGYRKDTPFITTVYKQINHKNIQLKLRVSEATEEFPQIYGFGMEKGRFLRDSDKNTCVIGSEIAKELNIGVGDYFMSKNVVGIISRSNQLIDDTVFVSGYVNNGTNVIMPHKGFGSGIFLICVKKPYHEKDIVHKAFDYIYTVLHPNEDRGAIINMKDKIEDLINIFTSLYTLLSIFTFLALLSSFLSLSALLFIEVIRKTREIGIKKAIGATSKEITKEFTLKGLKTTIIALLIGIPIGILISLIIEKLKGWNYYIPVNILILVILISLLLGFVFSFLPAYFASKTNPVEAIKSE